MRRKRTWRGAMYGLMAGLCALSSSVTGCGCGGGGESGSGVVNDLTEETKNSESLYSWGLNTSGRLGHAESGIAPVEGMAGSPSIEDISAGDSHSLAIVGGKLWGWGSNKAGQILPQKDFEPAFLVAATTPRAMTKDGEKVVLCSAGAYHSAAVIRAENSDVVRVWGALPNIYDAAITDFAMSERVAQIVSGNEHILLRTETGKVLALGNNVFGQLGVISGSQYVKAWTQVSLEASAIMIAAGAAHSAAVTVNHRVFAWGWNNRGQVRGGYLEVVSSPLLVFPSALTVSPAPAPVIRDVALGKEHSLLLVETPATGLVSLLSWGSNLFGQLGWKPNVLATAFLGTADIAEPQHILRIAAGGNHSAALMNDGRIFAWGSNLYGEALGTNPITGTTNNSVILTPTEATLPAKALRIALGSNHTLATTTP